MLATRAKRTNQYQFESLHARLELPRFNETITIVSQRSNRNHAKRIPIRWQLISNFNFPKNKGKRGRHHKVINQLSPVAILGGETRLLLQECRPSVEVLQGIISNPHSTRGITHIVIQVNGSR